MNELELLIKNRTGQVEEPKPETCINGCESNALEGSCYCYECYVRIRW
jgi:hypothetical protein